jgi:hypothetical protein
VVEPVVEPVEPPAEPVVEDLSIQNHIKKYTDRYGEKGLAYLTAGLSLDQAQAKYNQDLTAENKALNDRLSAIEAAGGSLGDPDGVHHSPTGGSVPKEKRNTMTGLSAALFEGIKAKKPKS